MVGSTAGSGDGARSFKASLPQGLPAPRGRVARETGLEPATSGVTGRRSNQLSYSPAG